MLQPKVCEWPTLALIVVVYGIWLAVLSLETGLGLAVSLAITAIMVTLHSSLQHEVLHGHPTRNAWINEALVYLPLGVFVPYRRFKALHLRHHNNDRLTDPYDDPESFYYAWSDWQGLPKPLRWILSVNNTLLGRLTIGPLVSMVGFWGAEARGLLANDPGVRNAWGHHAAGLALVIFLVTQVGGLDFWVYALVVAYPAMSLLMLRTFAEHRAHETPEGRSVIVEFCPVFSLLFLNNNLHVVHHAHPRVSWYQLPTLYRSRRKEWQKRNDGYVYPSYLALMLQYFLTPKEPVPHPLVGVRHADSKAMNRDA
ncbi:fatty acid desaturase [Roseibium polysiphoniae]|uniref:Fatty acid desaturase n=1 Tax=Roseibium polysiphoniae TaxID=2571221 RepID=A0A944CER3_9HYPH|nr:fatty acid desaturase [Roseibium polysiphoniae]